MVGRAARAAPQARASSPHRTIAIVEDAAQPGGGTLRLQWDTTELLVPFVVRRKRAEGSGL